MASAARAQKLGRVGRRHGAGGGGVCALGALAGRNPLCHRLRPCLRRRGSVPCEVACSQGTCRSPNKASGYMYSAYMFLTRRCGVCELDCVSGLADASCAPPLSSSTRRCKCPLLKNWFGPFVLLGSCARRLQSCDPVSTMPVCMWVG